MEQKNPAPSLSGESDTSLLVEQESAGDSGNTQPMLSIQAFQELANKLIEMLSDVKIIKEVVADLVDKDSWQTQFETAAYDEIKDLQLLKNRLSSSLCGPAIFDCQWDDSFNQALDEKDDIVAIIRAKRTLPKRASGILQGLTSVFSRNQTNAPVSGNVAAQFEAVVTAMYKQLMSYSFVRECATQIVIGCDPRSQNEVTKLYEKVISRLEMLTFSLRLYYSLSSIERISFDLVKRQVPTLNLYAPSSPSSAAENATPKLPSQIPAPIVLPQLEHVEHVIPPSLPSSPSVSPSPSPSHFPSPSHSPSPQANGLFQGTALGEKTPAQPTAPALPSPFAKKVSLEDYFRTQYIAGIPEGLNDVILPVAAAYDPKYAPLIKQLGIIPERGMILYGPPGTGKTIMAQAIAGYLGCPDERIAITSGSNLLDRWVGSTEASIRDLFYPARKDREHLHMIIIDEIDAILTTRQKAQNSWERTQVTQFLTELDGIKSPKNVFVIGITNCIEHLDPAAIRPGRLGSLIGVPLPDLQQRARIFELHLSFISECRLATSYACMAQALSNLTEGFSGADIRAVVQRTANLTFMSTIRAGHFRDSEGIAECDKLITTNDFVPVIEFIIKQKALSAYD